MAFICAALKDAADFRKLLSGAREGAGDSSLLSILVD